MRPLLTVPQVVPMTPEQHDQAVAALATMIGDWIRTRPAATAAPKPAYPGPACQQLGAQYDRNQRERT
jgi:hypothetical protein